MLSGAYTRHIYRPGTGPYKVGSWVEKAGERERDLAKNINRMMSTHLRHIELHGIP